MTTSLAAQAPSSVLYKASKEIADELKKYCGPYAEYAFIHRAAQFGGSGKNMGNIDEWTKDGITITEAIKSNKFSTEMFLRLINVIGKRIDRSVNDGTTTAMLLFCLIVKSWEAKFPKDHKIPKITYMRKFNEMLKNISNILDTEVALNVKKFKDILCSSSKGMEKVSLPEWNRYVAYHAALISSKGDTELAKCISEIIYRTPIEALVPAWQVNINNEEADAGYKVIPVDHDFEMTNCMFGREGKTYLNAEHETIGIYEDAYVIYSDRDLAMNGDYSNFIKALAGLVPGTSHTPEEEQFVSNLRARYGLSSDPYFYYIDKPLFIFTPKRGDHRLAAALEQIETATGVPIIMVQHNLDTTNTRLHKLYSEVLNALGLAIPFNHHSLGGGDDRFVFSVMRGVKVKLFRTTIQLTFERFDDSDEQYHPLFNKSLDEVGNSIVYNYYNNILKETEEYIGFIKTNQFDRYSSTEIEMINELRFSIISRQRLALQIYGTVHHALASHSVVQDGFGSAFSAVTDGFVISGYVSLLDIVVTTYDTTLDPVDRFVADVLQDALKELLSTIYRTQITTPITLYGQPNVHSVFPLEKNYVPSGTRLTSPPINSSCIINPENSTPVLIQPLKAFSAQLQRYQDMAKLFNTTTIINPSAEMVIAMDDETE